MKGKITQELGNMLLDALARRIPIAVPHPESPLERGADGSVRLLFDGIDVQATHTGVILRLVWKGVPVWELDPSMVLPPGDVLHVIGVAGSMPLELS